MLDVTRPNWTCSWFTFLSFSEPKLGWSEHYGDSSHFLQLNFIMDFVHLNSSSDLWLWISLELKSRSMIMNSWIVNQWPHWFFEILKVEPGVSIVNVNETIEDFMIIISLCLFFFFFFFCDKPLCLFEHHSFIIELGF